MKKVLPVILGVCLLAAGVAIGRYGEFTAEGQNVGDVQEGTQPFTPSRVQWLAMELNSLEMPYFLPDGRVIFARYYASGPEDITAHVRYTEGTEPSVIREFQIGSHNAVMTIAESYGWDHWVEVDVNRSEIPMETSQ